MAYDPNKILPTDTVKIMMEKTNQAMDGIDQVDADLASHKSAPILDHPDGSVTDAKIGDRTIDQTKVPSNSTGSMTNLFSWVANRIKAITGKTNWYDTPTKSLEALNTDKLNKDGTQAMTGALTLFGDPTSSMHASTKQYVDSTKSNLPMKDPVVVATTGNITLSGTQSIDGVSLSIGNRVLVKDQSTGSQNGIYVVQSGAWARTTDFNSISNMISGSIVYVQKGTKNADQGFEFTTDGSITVGTTALVFTQFTGTGMITTENGLYKQDNKMGIADNGVTDSKIGDRTLTDSTVPTTSTGQLVNLLSGLANRIKSITGKANWYDAPIKSMDGLNTDITNTANDLSNHKGSGGSAHATVSSAQAGFMSPTDKNKLDGVAQGAEVNQNTFSTVKVGATSLDADSKTDVLELANGTGISLTPDATNDKITIAVNSTSAGGTESSKIAMTNLAGRVGDSEKVGGLSPSDLDGKYAPASHVGATGNAHGVATSSVAGFMSPTDKNKLDGLQTGAEPNQFAFSSIKVGTATVDADSKTDVLTLASGTGITISADPANDVITVTATGEMAPAAHASTHLQGGSDPIPEATTTSDGLLSSSDKVKLNGIASGAEVNQNAFSTIKIGTTNIDADGKTDVLELVQGTSIILTPDATNDKVTIAVKASDFATATHVHGVATNTVAGFMGTADRTKLDGMAPGAEVNQNAFTSIKVGATTVDADSKTDIVEFVAGSNISITPDITNDKITFSLTGKVGDSDTVDGKHSTDLVLLDGSQAMTGALTLSADPVNALHAATKQYVDHSVQGLDSKGSVRVATTGNITLSGVQTIDGVLLSVGDRVLVKDQSTASQNGIYVVQSGAWLRSDDANISADITTGMYAWVEEGTENVYSGWRLNTKNPIVLGTTALTFGKFSAAGEIIAGSGISKSGNTLSVMFGTNGAEKGITKGVIAPANPVEYDLWIDIS